jgi:uncharacterized protein involved in exopolysaccharide biosynthesis
VIGTQPAEATEQRIEAIRQQIINRPALIGLIETNNLYENQRASTPLSELIEDMRDSITLESQAIDIAATRREQTISVRLGFTYHEAVGAQAVTQQLMERIVEVDSTTNTSQLTETVQFLNDQQAEVQVQIAEMEQEVAAFNRRYGGILSSGNAPVIGGAGASYDIQIAALQREIASLRAQRDNMRSAPDRDPAVVNAEASLAAARARYTESHPDVILAKQNLAQAQEFAQRNTERVPTGSLERQIAFNNSQISQLRAAKARELAQVSAVASERAQGPALQQQSEQLQQRLATLYAQSEEISGRLLAARAGARANEEQMGERLRVVDPPVIPDTPAFPNRPLVAGAGIVGGLALGLMLALAVEMLFSPIRDPSTLTRLTGGRPLAMVPVIGPLPDADQDLPKPGLLSKLAFWRKKDTYDDS